MIFLCILQIVSSLLAPTIAIVGIGVSLFNYRLDKKRRKDDLFDRRYKFYKDFEEIWKSTGNEAEGATKCLLEWDDLAPWIQEANFLFDEDIIKHIKSYDGKCFNGNRWFPDLEYAKPFEMYLKLN